MVYNSTYIKTKKRAHAHFKPLNPQKDQDIFWRKYNWWFLTDKNKWQGQTCLSKPYPPLIVSWTSNGNASNKTNKNRYMFASTKEDITLSQKERQQKQNGM